jgi:uncharacterized protein (TIGR00290 family)
MDFAMSYSGGKDSALVLHKLIEEGHRLVALVINSNPEQGRSWFHGIPNDLFEVVADSLGVPLIICDCTPDDYNEAFERGLAEAKALGAEACAFGDIDIEQHREWDEARAAAAGLTCLLPLWQQDRDAVVAELLERGIKAVIKVVDLSQLDESLLGLTLTTEVVEQIKASGADACGENGEYHTFVYDGPAFTYPVPFSIGEVVDLETHKSADIRMP